MDFSAYGRDNVCAFVKDMDFSAYGRDILCSFVAFATFLAFARNTGENTSNYKVRFAKFMCPFFLSRTIYT